MSKKLTTEEFIAKARRVHGDKYDYSKVEYINSRTKVCIICPEHGEFWQVGGEHLRGQGCVKCSGREIFNQEDFLKKCFEVHGDKYDYSKTIYKNNKEKVTVICKEHGEFKILPSQHLRYGGCPACRKEKSFKKITHDEFIEKAQQLHGDKYDYSQIPDVIYYYDEIITIGCPIHGYFTTTAYLHIDKKRGCKKCNSRGLSTDEWIERFRNVHGDKYDYSEFVYDKNNSKSKIICKKHGVFYQTPSKHVSGQGCPKCGLNRLHDLNCRTTEQFIEEAKAIHGDKYDYSKVNYVNNHTLVTIICPKHGEYKQQPTTHLCQGSGCKKCATENDTPRKRDTKESFIEKARKVHGDKYDYAKVNYTDSYTPVIITCPEHGDFSQIPNSHLNGRGCPKCGNHKTELLICNILNNLNIPYVYDQPQPWLTYKGYQRLDFYFPQYKSAIEYQGEEHFFPIDFAGKGEEWAKEQFTQLQLRDKNKHDLCKKNGVSLFYINYNDNVEERLNEVLLEIQSFNC